MNMSAKKCRLCGSDRTQVCLELKRMPLNIQRLLKKDELPKDRFISMQVIQCNDCGFIQLPAVLSEDYYDDYLMVTTHSAQMQEFQRIQSIEFVSKYELFDKKIIEIGCGDGNYLSHLKNAGATAVGLEPSSIERELALKKGFTVYSGYVDRDRIIENGLYDAFVIRQVLEHVPEIHNFLQGIKRNLKPGGYGLIEVPSVEKAILDRRFYDFFPDHVNYFSQRTLCVALEINGFEVLEMTDGMYGEYNVAIVQLPKRDSMNLVQDSVKSLSREIEEFIGQRKLAGEIVAVWGAGGKGLSIMSAADVSKVDVLIDSDPHKWSLYTPVSHLQVQAPQVLKKVKVDAIIVTAMAYKNEIIRLLRQEYMFKGPIALLGHSLELAE